MLAPQGLDHCSADLPFCSEEIHVYLLMSLSDGLLKGRICLYYYYLVILCVIIRRGASSPSFSCEELSKTSQLKLNACCI